MQSEKQCGPTFPVSAPKMAPFVETFRNDLVKWYDINSSDTDLINATANSIIESKLSGETEEIKEYIATFLLGGISSIISKVTDLRDMKYLDKHLDELLQILPHIVEALGAKLYIDHEEIELQGKQAYVFKVIIDKGSERHMLAKMLYPKHYLAPILFMIDVALMSKADDILRRMDLAFMN